MHKEEKIGGHVKSRWSLSEPNNETLLHSATEWRLNILVHELHKNAASHKEITARIREDPGKNVTFLVFEPICAYTRCAQMHHILSVYTSVTRSKFISHQPLHLGS